MRICIISTFLSVLTSATLAEEMATFPASPKSVESAIAITEALKKSQTVVDESQDKAARHLSFAPGSSAPVVELQKLADKAQEEANRALSEVKGLQSHMKKLVGEAKVFYGYATKAAEDSAKAQATVKAQESELVRLREEVAAEEAKLGNPDTFKDRTSKEAEEGRRALGEKIHSLKYKIGQVEGHLAHAKRQISYFAEGSTKAWGTYRSNVERLEEALTKLPAAIKTANEKQAEALLAQKAAFTALSVLPPEALAGEKPAVPPHPNLATTTPAPVSHTSRPASISQILTEAESTESRIAEQYRGIRAIDLALIRELTIDEARASTDLPQPDRQPINQEILNSSPDTAEAMETFNREMGNALTQMDSRVRFAGQLLGAVSPQESGVGESMTGPHFSASSRSSFTNGPTGGTGAGASVGRLLEGAATDEEGTDAKDLTGLMHASYENINPYDDDDGGPARDLRGAFVPPSEVPDEKNMMLATPGRHVGVGLPSANWIYVDSWNLIGPFPNPDRRNKDRQFPPETVIDLDAVYEGREGEQVRWRFQQSGKPALMFPEGYSVTYAYTELWFDEARDLWIAAGADDAGRLWINDLLVWKSVDRLKPWRISEAYRKVSFKKGLNRVLYRVENGPDAGWFSLLIQMK